MPITGTDEAVAIPVNDLPEDVDEVLGILQAELAPLGLWLDLAKAYLQQGKEEQCKAILENGCGDGAFHTFPRAPVDNILTTPPTSTPAAHSRAIL